MSERSGEGPGRDIRTSATPEPGSQAPYGSEPGGISGEQGASSAFGRPSVEEEYRSQDVGEKAGEYAGRAKEKVSEYGDKALEEVEARKDQAALGMERVAESLRERSESQGGVAGQAGEKVAEGMQGAATYLREHGTEEMRGDFERYVREHPMQSLAGAAFVGFFLGRMLR